MLGPADLWYKSAIIYSVNVATFQDSNGDGAGDFPGLTSRLDHVHALGATCIWLTPFYASPNRDNRYDVSDYYAVDPTLGSLGDFVDFLTAARERGIRVIVDLVVNHTSDQHPWFLEARRNRASRYHDFYVWADEPPANANDGMVFPGVETSTWTHDAAAGRYYFHRFYSHQPDLNLGNPAVRDEIRKIMGFWLELGVSGFRLDAAPFLVDLKGVDPDAVERRRPHSFFRHLHDFVSWRRGDAVLLAEANVTMDEVHEYVGTGDRLQMMFNFFVNQFAFLALASGNATGLADALRGAPELPQRAQWAHFLRNHDELDLGRLTVEQRGAVYDEFAPDENMRLYQRGIRRRLAPMLRGDRRRIELAHSLLLALPGTPVLRYGDEIGMGDDLGLSERDSVRTPMQWAATHNGGFSSAPATALVRPVVTGEFGPSRVNVADQLRDPDSLLNWLQRAIRVRHVAREIAWGRATVLETESPSVLALLYTDAGRSVMTVHNFSDHAAELSLDLGAARRVSDLLSDAPYEPLHASASRLDLNPFGYRWLAFGDRRHWGTRPPV